MPDEARAVSNGWRGVLARRADLISTVFLASAALGSAWSAYESTRWTGVQLGELSRADALRSAATRASDRATGKMQVDVGVFVSWLVARATGNHRAMATLEERFRPEFREAFEDWLGKTGPLDPLPANTPFASPKYHVAERERTEVLTRQSEEASLRGRRANQDADNFVFCVVLFGAVAYFAGIATKVARPYLTASLLVVAGLLLLTAIVVLASLPPNIGFRNPST